MDETPESSTQSTICPPAPVARHQTTAIGVGSLRSPKASPSHEPALYSLFLSDLALIDRNVPLPELREEVDKSLAQFKPQTAVDVRIAYVADTSKLRQTRKMVENGLGAHEKRRLRNMTTAQSRRRCAGNLSQYHDKLDKLCGGRRSWLPRGIPVDTISYDTVLNLRKIIEWTLSHGERLDSLWEPGGHLHDVPYQKKPLDAVWKRLSQQSGNAIIHRPNCSNKGRQQDQDRETQQGSLQEGEEEDGSGGASGDDGSPNFNGDTKNSFGGEDDDGDWGPDGVDVSSSQDSDPGAEEESIEYERRIQRDTIVRRSLDDSFCFSRARSSATKDVDNTDDGGVFPQHSPLVKKLSVPAPIEPYDEDLVTKDIPDASRSTVQVVNPDINSNASLSRQNTGLAANAPFSAASPSSVPPPSLAIPACATNTASSVDPPHHPLPPAVSISRGSSGGSKWQTAMSAESVSDSTLGKREGRPASESLENVPKRQCVATLPKRRFDLRVRHGFNAECLEDGQYVEGTVISEVLSTFCALCPLSMMCIDPLVSNNGIPQRLRADFLSQRDMTILYPLNLTSRGKHWVLVTASTTSVNIYDSLPSATDEVELAGLLRSLLSLVAESTAPDDPPTPSRISCPQQSNTTDCGVAVIVNGLYVIAGQDIPATVEYSLWRRVLLAFSTGRKAVTEIVLQDSEQPLAVTNHGAPLPPAPPATMTEAELISWDERYREFRQNIMATARAQLGARLTHQQRMGEMLEDVIGVFGGLQLAGSGTPGMDQIHEELANCHSALQSLARLRRAETSMIDELKARCARLAEAQGRRAIVQLELAKLTDVMHDECELLNDRLAAFRPWDVLYT
ncbi:Putative Ulp1 protease family catalytic domain, papain-like cysteine peptidase superfamily [Colletotrichum destructivum]|uniref:Ulp1 protease family catalytic domain, papain-like cysteine peptidase superfamily n=1 Tax=Colletotrichum destructivum TaxID=34406 RepID=A0AAX4J4F4_9PEZI|nr:Putative Ulp1 protease family catalytic domain, papain-like cysteine peptidase superfamily [Colletotrichum destructivum]